MYYRMISMGNMFFFFKQRTLVFTSTDGLKSVPANNWRLLGRGVLVQLIA